MSVSPVGSSASKAIEEGQPFRLLDLPRELRDRLYYYSYVPSSSDNTITQWNQKWGAQRKNLCEAKPSSLLGPVHVLNHQIHDEMEEYLARLPNETVTLEWPMFRELCWVEHQATRFARCPKVTSVVLQAMGPNWERDWRDMFPYDVIVCNELLAILFLFRTNGTKVQTVTFDHSAKDISHDSPCMWSSRVQMRNHSVLEERGDIRITINVHTLEISELSGSLAPLLKMELIEALEDFQELLSVDESRNAFLWLSEPELVQYEDEKSHAYLSYLNWLCNEEWKIKWPDNKDVPYWNLEIDEEPDSWTQSTEIQEQSPKATE